MKYNYYLNMKTFYCVCGCVCVRMKYFPGPEQSRAVFIQYNTWIHLTTFHHNVQNCKHDHHHHRDHSCMQLLQVCTHRHVSVLSVWASLIILFTYCILPINGHKQENKSIKLTCCVLLASKFVDITEISLALFMEADVGWYNTEKMELSSRTSIRLCFVTWSMLIPNFPHHHRTNSSWLRWLPQMIWNQLVNIDEPYVIWYDLTFFPTCVSNLTIL